MDEAINKIREDLQCLLELAVIEEGGEIDESRLEKAIHTILEHYVETDLIEKFSIQRATEKQMDVLVQPTFSFSPRIDFRISLDEEPKKVRTNKEYLEELLNE